MTQHTQALVRLSGLYINDSCSQRCNADFAFHFPPPLRDILLNMGLTPEAIIGLVTLLITCPSSLLALWAWINRRKVQAGRRNPILSSLQLRENGLAFQRTPDYRQSIFPGELHNSSLLTVHPVDIELGLESTLTTRYQCTVLDSFVMGGSGEVRDQSKNQSQLLRGLEPRKSLFPNGRTAISGPGTHASKGGYLVSNSAFRCLLNGREGIGASTYPRDRGMS